MADEVVRECNGRRVADTQQRAVLQFRGLRLDGFDDSRMPVSVDNGPQRCHRVYVLPTIDVDQAVPFSPLHNQLRLGVEAGHLRKGMPYAIGVSHAAVGWRPFSKDGQSSWISKPMSSISCQASFVDCPGVVR